MLTHILVKMSKSWKFQPNWSNNTLKTGFFRICGKTGSRFRNFFDLKPPCDKDGANKKKFSQIGPAVPELLSLTHTNTHTDKNPYFFVVLIKGHTDRQTDIHTDKQRSYYFRVRILVYLTATSQHIDLILHCQ